jgi:hypothetical protein
MLIAGRTPRDYFVASREFLAVVLILSGITVFGRLTGYVFDLVQYLLFAALPVIGWAGWHAVRKHRFTSAQTAIIGLILSCGSHWMLPIFHSAGEIAMLFVVNSIVFTAITLCGGLLARKVLIH